MTFVRTVRGDIDPRELGTTYVHEHLIIDSPTVASRSPEISLPSPEEALAEVRLCAAAGARAMVDAMPIGAGRNPEKLAAIAQGTSIHVIMATGLHLPMYYPTGSAFAAATGDLARLFIADIVEGADAGDHRGPEVERTDIRAGVIKIATAGDPLDARDQRVIAAAAEAHHRTGAPILTHCEGGLGGLAQVEGLAAHGVDAPRVTLSHTDKILDAAYHHDLLSTGVNVEYDQALRQPADIEQGTAWLVTEMLHAGFVNQIMLGTDGARRSMWSTLGGAPGLAWLLTGIAEQLRRHGVAEADIARIFVTNPERWLSFGEPR